MKGLLISLSLVFVSLSCGLMMGTNIASSHNGFPSANFASPSPMFEPGNPVKLEIPKLGISSEIKAVGLDSERKMGVPVDDISVGWYSLGFKPGEKGNAVIDGHLDTVTGRPAIFYNLSKLQPGDLIMITDDKGNKYTYTVKQRASYPYDLFPLDEIFGSSDTQNLNLITCEGHFDSTSANYSHRTVIYSGLSEVIASSF